LFQLYLDSLLKTLGYFFFCSLPDDEKQVPTIGNGHVATLVYSDTVYMNGLYTGLRGDSHRAR